MPSGGQFSAHAHSEADIDALISDMGYQDLDPNEALHISDMSARRRARSVDRIDPEELSADTIADYFHARKTARDNLWSAYVNGTVVEPGAVLQNPGAYINAISKNLVQRYLTGESQSADRAAIKMLRETARTHEQDTGRKMTSIETEELAEEIRMSQPPRRRAKAGFHIRRHEVLPSANSDGSLTVVEEEADGSGRRVSDGTAYGDDFAEGELGDQIIESFADGRAAVVHDARRRAWDAVAGRSGAPQVTQGVLGETEASVHRRTIKASGGINAVCDRWSDETASAAESKALFAPFGGDLSYSQQERVVSEISNLGAYSEDVFDGALAGATKTRAKARAPGSEVLV